MGVVNVYVKDQDGNVLEDVLVKLVDSAGVIQSQNFTDSSGLATLDCNVTGYQYIRMFKPGVIFDGQLGPSNASPQRVYVRSSGTRSYSVVGRVPVLPESVDNRLCLVSGRLVGPTFEPYHGRSLVIMPDPDTERVADPDLMMLLSSQVTPDEDGKVYFNLLRGSVYTISLMEQQWKVYVPDQPAVSIQDLLFPVTDFGVIGYRFYLHYPPIPTNWRYYNIPVIRTDGWEGTWQEVGLVPRSWNTERIEVDTTRPGYFGLRAMVDGWYSDLIYWEFTDPRRPSQQTEWTTLVRLYT